MTAETSYSLRQQKNNPTIDVDKLDRIFTNRNIRRVHLSSVLVCVCVCERIVESKRIPHRPFSGRPSNQYGNFEKSHTDVCMCVCVRAQRSTANVLSFGSGIPIKWKRFCPTTKKKKLTKSPNQWRNSYAPLLDASMATNSIYSNGMVFGAEDRFENSIPITPDGIRAAVECDDGGWCSFCRWDETSQRTATRRMKAMGKEERGRNRETDM